MGWAGKSIFYNIAEKIKLINSKIDQVLKQQKDVVLGGWGVHALPELQILNRFNVPIVYEFLTYLMSLTSPAVKTGNILNKKIINRLDGRILTSHRMLGYLKNNFGIEHGKNLIFGEYYSKRCFYRERLPRLSEKDGEPHIIFIGYNTNEVFGQISKILQQKIHVHTLQNKSFEQRLKGLKANTYSHSFKKFTFSDFVDGTFATFMTQFDACLCTYDFQKKVMLDRFYYSIPERFSFATTAGIPIIMPFGYLKVCEDIINNYQTGFTYQGYDDLKNSLTNNNLMTMYQKNAVANSKKFNLENNFEILNRFLRNIRA